VLLLLDNGKIKEVDRELEWYWFLIDECLYPSLEDNRQDVIKIISKEEGLSSVCSCPTDKLDGVLERTCSVKNYYYAFVSILTIGSYYRFAESAKAKMLQF